MNYPLISEYVEAIRFAEDNFDKLANLRPVLDDNGNPIMSSGNFAVVFKMRDVSTGRLFAVKCFTKEQEGRSERYAKITEELQFVYSPYILHVQYIDRELFVNTTNCDEEEFPVLVMDWVEGQPLDAYLRENMDDEYALQMLAYRFCNMGAWLLSQPFAHGDLKPDNILVRDDGTLVLVDYDGMYVPSMKGEKTYEIGSPDFRHPQRTADDFDEHIDDFSIASIALSLKAIVLDTQLYSQYAAADRLLFSTADYRDISQSSALQAIVRLSSDAELSLLLGLFLLALSKNSLGLVSFRLLLLSEPQKPVVIETLSTEITDEERRNAVKDAFGATYTADGLKLIEVPCDVKEYVIEDGTKVIGNRAFYWCDSLVSITIPNSVTSIGGNAFFLCESLTSITIPNSVTSIGNYAFWCCKSLTSITIPNSVTSIGRDAFFRCESLTSITIPNSVTSIGNSAFNGCESLTSITIPNSVTSIGDGIFSGCKELQNVILETSKFYVHENILYSKEGRVISCWSSNSHLIIPQGVTSIGVWAFCGCRSLTSITIPKGMTSIGDWAFCWCESLTSITIPNSVTSIGKTAFCECVSLNSIRITKGTRDKMLKLLGDWSNDKLVEI